MPNLTDGAIRQAIRQVQKSGKQKSLTDGKGRGTGRLVLILKPMPRRVTAEWMAQQWRDGKRSKKKIGSYPSMSLAGARETFKRDYANLIQKGRSIRIACDTRPGTVADLFEAYIGYLKGNGKSSWKEAQKGLIRIADTLGRNRPAREIEPDEVVEIIRPIYERGARAMADHVRSYIRSAYGWGMKSEHDYRAASPRRFNLVYNPAAGIPTEPKVAGTRWLTEEEFVRLYRWLECPDVPVHPPYCRAVRLIMLTGQRVEEIATLHVDQWDAAEKIIDWSRTKNLRPHAIPLPSLAAELIEQIKPNGHGWFFPSAKILQNRSATPRSMPSSGASASAMSFRSSPTAIFAGPGRRSPARPASPRKSATASRTMLSTTSAQRATTAGTTCPKSATAWKRGTASSGQC